MNAPYSISANVLLSFNLFTATINDKIRLKQKTTRFLEFIHIAVKAAKASADCPLGKKESCFTPLDNSFFLNAPFVAKIPINVSIILKITRYY